MSMNPSDRCRLCSCNFKVKFGNLKSSHISTENLFNPSKRKDCKGEVLAQICQKVGIEVVKCDEYSSRVCNPCARKIRNLGSLYSFVQESIQGEVSKSTPTKSTPVKKRLLDTPEGKSPIRKSVRVLSPVTKANNGKSPRKTLKFVQERLQTSEKENEENLDHYLNIDNLPEGGLPVKVVYKTNSGNIFVRTPRDEKTKCLVRQICDKNWHAAANTMTNHSELYQEVLKAVNKNASNEMSEYLKSESMLLCSKPDEITGFSNTVFLEEVRIFCPVLYYLVLAACNIQESDVKVKGTAANSVALASAIMCRLRNPKASALHYRISTVMFHSGAKHQDLVRLNRLGVSMSPKQMVRAQSEMGNQLEGKVNVWKSQIEETKCAQLLLEELKVKQVPVRVESDMEITTEVQVDKDTVVGYNSFTPQGHECLLREIEITKQRKGESTCTDETLSDVERALANSRLPLYRQVH